ncbi:16S rRNA (guanine(966)-N(2))-methyltransferase RsmD [bacterium]|nr:16S rRNA (guanine(966)-N(2))-methyltransferase RsmD [bacterium]
MRITGGEFNGMKLKFKHNKVRPTLSKIREAVFNMLGPSIKALTFVDTFAGSGIMGFEALSRGAKFVHFNDIDQRVLNIILENLQLLSISKDRYRITKRSGLKLVKHELYNNSVYYFDPPFGFKNMEELLEKFEMKIGNYGIFEFPLDKKYNFHYIIKEKRYGSIKIIMEKVE